MEQETKKKIISAEMLQRLDSHYEIEETLKSEINIKVQKLNEIRDEIKLMQTLIMFQMKKEYSKKNDGNN